jgi:hypothetical protein
VWPPLNKRVIAATLTLPAFVTGAVLSWPLLWTPEVPAAATPTPAVVDRSRPIPTGGRSDRRDLRGLPALPSGPLAATLETVDL